MENGWERGRKVATVRKFRRWLKLILSGKKSVWSQQWGRRLKTPVLDYDHILNLEHKFKTWLIRITRMKFNIWIKEIIFITRFPYLCYYHESFQLLRSLCWWLCCYMESRANRTEVLTIYVSMLPGTLLRLKLSGHVWLCGYQMLSTQNFWPLSLHL